MHYTRLVALATLATTLALVGCESSDDIDGNVWMAQTTSAETSSTANTTTTTASRDAVSFSSLNWSFGGFNGSGAKISSPSIGNLRISGDTLTYSWTGTTLRAWGISDEDHRSTLICLFVKRNDGAWVGGKFDWVSTSRTSRNLENVFHGYEGWSLAGVPNPCEAAMVIVHVDGSKRTNVTKGTWTR